MATPPASVVFARSQVRIQTPTLGARGTETAMTTTEHDPPRRTYRWLAWTVFLASAAWVAVGSVLLLVDFANGSFPAHVIVGQFTLLPPAASKPIGSRNRT